MHYDMFKYRCLRVSLVVFVALILISGFSITGGISINHSLARVLFGGSGISVLHRLLQSQWIRLLVYLSRFYYSYYCSWWWWWQPCCWCCYKRYTDAAAVTDIIVTDAIGRAVLVVIAIATTAVAVVTDIAVTEIVVVSIVGGTAVAVVTYVVGVAVTVGIATVGIVVAVVTTLTCTIPWCPSLVSL